MVEEDFISVHLMQVSIFELIFLEVKELIGVLTGALCVLALSNVYVDDSNHGHLLLKVNLCAY